MLLILYKLSKIAVVIVAASLLPSLLHGSAVKPEDSSDWSD
jgi:hypothetical protein